MKKEIKLNQVPKIESIQDMILQNTKKYSGKIALEDLQNTPVKRLTFSDLLSAILKFGSALRKTGLKERAHIAVIGENRVQWALSYLTCMCFNYVIVPIDRNLHTNEILNILHESDAEAVIFSESFGVMLSEKMGSLKKLKYYISMDAVDEGYK
ncbi:MAG: AMP-binding protein, partial [Bacteroidota bacterium]